VLGVAVVLVDNMSTLIDDIGDLLHPTKNDPEGGIPSGSKVIWRLEKRGDVE
jgi:hypothetical protein